MCHQSVGLIARELESRGIPTLSMSSARSITAAVNPPRAVYLDYPLGRTAGKVNDKANQMAIMEDTLKAFASIEAPGTIVDLVYAWRDDDVWKDSVMRPQSPRDDAQSHSDDRIARVDTPQYQSAADELDADAACPTCVFLEEQK